MRILRMLAESTILLHFSIHAILYIVHQQKDNFRSIV